MSIIQNSAYCYLQHCKGDNSYKLFAIVQTSDGFAMETPTSPVPSAVYFGGSFSLVLEVKPKSTATAQTHYFGPIAIANNSMDPSTDMVDVKVQIYDANDDVTDQYKTLLRVADADSVDTCISDPIAYNCPYVRLLHVSNATNQKKPRCVIPVGQGVSIQSEILSFSSSPGQNNDIRIVDIVLMSSGTGTTLLEPSQTNIDTYSDNNTADGHFGVTVLYQDKPRKGKVRNANSTIQPFDK